MEQQKSQDIVSIPVQITSKMGCPCVCLRKEITDFDLIRNIVHCAMHDKPIIIMPKFQDKFIAQNALIQKGIIYKDNDGVFKFNI